MVRVGKNWQTLLGVFVVIALVPAGLAVAHEIDSEDHSATESAVPPPDSALTEEEAQAYYDPEDEPDIIVGKEPDGSIDVSHIYIRDTKLPDGFPSIEEAEVQTPEELDAYIEDLNEYVADEGGSPGQAP